jgi:RNA polymerase sigma-70 factor (ECF subfamily)
MDVFTSSSVIAGQSGSGDDGDLPSLVERVRSGDPSSLERLLARVQSRVRIWAQQFTGDSDAAEDVTQEVLIGLERRVRKFDGASGFSTWLYAVTRNVALSSRRTDQRRLALIERRARTAPDSAAESPNQTDASALATLALRYFDALPRRQRQIFELVDVRGMSPAEAARQLGMEQVTVRGHLFKARRAIRAKMLARHEQLLNEYMS